MNHDSLVFFGGNEGLYACGQIVMKRLCIGSEENDKVVLEE